MIRVELVAPHDEVTTWYFTFGVGQPNAGRFVKIEGTFFDARAEMVRRFGRVWAFQYDENDWTRDGITQDQRYGLTELRL